MATVTKGRTFTSGETVTATKLNDLADLATVSNIVNADISASAAIAHTKLANITAGQILLGNASNIPTATALSGDVTVNSTGVAAISSGVVINADISATAAIAHTKLANITAGQILMGNASNIPTATAVSGDATLASTGALTISNAAVTAAKLNGAQTGSAPIFGVRAWVNFNGTAAANIGGTYSRSGTTVTVDTTVAHNFQIGHTVYLNFESGAAVDGAFTIATVPNSTQFTITHGTSGTTSGTVSVLRRSIRASGNVAHVTYHNSAGVYSVNFTTALPDSDYAIAGFANFTTTATAGLVGGNSTHAPGTLACLVRVANSTIASTLDVSHVNVMFIR